MGYLEEKVDFLVEKAKAYCGTEATDGRTRQMIACDILELTGALFLRQDPGLLRKSGALLSVFPLLKKDAEGLFLERLKQLEDACLSIQVAIKKAQEP